MKFVKEKKKSFLLLVFIQQKIDSSCDHFTKKSFSPSATKNLESSERRKLFEIDFNTRSERTTRSGKFNPIRSTCSADEHLISLFNSL